MSRLAPKHNVRVNEYNGMNDKRLDMPRISKVTWRALHAAYNPNAVRQLVVFIDDNYMPPYPCAIVTFHKDGRATWNDVTSKGNVGRDKELPHGTRKLHEKTMYMMAGVDMPYANLNVNHEEWHERVYARNMSLYVGRSHRACDGRNAPSDDEWKRFSDFVNEPKKLMWGDTNDLPRGPLWKHNHQ